MLAGLLDQVAGVPTHPLVVHAPVVLVPIAAVAAVVLAVRPDLRARLGWWPLGAVAVIVGLLLLAKESGEALEGSGNVLGDVEEHTELGETTFVIGLVWLATTAALAVRDATRRARTAGSLSAGAAAGGRDVATAALAAASALVAIVTTIWLVRTGHSGSESRWVG